MMNQLCVEKSKASKTRKAPFLPRFGFYLEFAGREISYKHAPILEAILNLRSRGFSQANLMDLAQEVFNEIRLPVQARKAVKSAPKAAKPKKSSKTRSTLKTRK